MKFGLAFANAGPFSEPELAIASARLAEDLGFESLWTVEHVVVPTAYASEYPYSPDGRMPGGEDVPIPDPLIWLAYVGGATSTIRLATGILILPQRNPVILAKELATLDRLTGGRVDLGVGIGWLEEEFNALGVPYEQRGARTEEYVDVLRKLWREPETSYDGAFARFGPLKSYPKPATAAGPKIHIGGHTAPAARRAGRIGDGFFPGRGGDELVALIDEMRKAAADAGRDADTIEITAGGAPTLDGVRQAADVGASRYLLPPLGYSLEKLKTRLGKFSETVIAHAG